MFCYYINIIVHMQNSGLCRSSGGLCMKESLWTQAYPMTAQPSMEQVETYVSSPYWKQIIDWIEASYHASPSVEYSKELPGWNVKYKKGSKSLCTIYPEKGRFTVLTVVPPKKEMEAQLMLGSLSTVTRGIFTAARPMAIGRWLMIPVESDTAVEDVRKLITLRVPV